MLRQIWRQRGAYNVVNLPFAASQDDPGSSPGRADRSADWRRHYNPALEPEFREDVGLEAWDRANWWTDRQLSSTAAAKILRKRLETYGPQKERSLQEVISRIRSEKDAVMALKAAELFRRHRSSKEQHTPFKNSTSKMIVQRALEVDARDVAVQALARQDELGFNFISLKAYRHAITHFSTKGDLENVLKVWEIAKKQGLKPNRDVGFCILRACLDCKRPDLAYAYALEFEDNGMRISPAQRIKIEAEAGKLLPAPPQASSETVETGSDPKAVGASDSDDVIVKEVADRIISAVSASSEKDQLPPVDGASLSAGSVSSTGEPEVVASTEAAPHTIVTAEQPDSQPAGGGSRVAAAVSVEPDSQAVASEAAQASSQPQGSAETGLETREIALEEVPGLEAAVAEKMRKLFPPKAIKDQPQGLRRANSV